MLWEDRNGRLGERSNPADYQELEEVLFQQVSMHWVGSIYIEAFRLLLYSHVIGDEFVKRFKIAKRGASNFKLYEVSQMAHSVTA